MPSCATRRTSSNPGSDKQRRPGVAHQRNARARAQLLQQLVDAFALVVFVQRHQRPRQPKRCQQLPRPARVFRRDQFRGRKFIARAWRKIAEIADWRRDHRKTPQVRCHYNSPPRQDAQALVKAIRRMTPKKALVRPFAVLVVVALAAGAHGLPDHAPPWRTAERRSRRSNSSAPATMPAPRPSTSAWQPKPPAATAPNSACAPRVPGSPPGAPPTRIAYSRCCRAGSRSNRRSNRACCASSPRWSPGSRR